MEAPGRRPDVARAMALVRRGQLSHYSVRKSDGHPSAGQLGLDQATLEFDPGNRAPHPAGGRRLRLTLRSRAARP